MGATVWPVRDQRDIEAWIRLPRTVIYPPGSHWTPPLDSDLRRTLDSAKNPFFRHGTGRAFLAAGDDGRLAGRIYAHVYHRHTVRHGERTGFFGYFESVDEPAVAQSLLAAARQFAGEHDCVRLCGPFNLTAMQEMGVVTEGFDEPPAVDEIYSAPYYPRLLESAGLRPCFPVTTFRIDDLPRLDPATIAGGRVSPWGDRLRCRSANRHALDDDLETVRELLNDSFYDNPFFVPVTRAEFDFQVGPYKRLMDPAISLFAELDGVPAGFVLCVPDFNPLLRRMRGRLGPRALAMFLRERGRLRDAVLIINGVLRPLQGRGVMRVLIAEAVRRLQARGYQRLTITWIADQNAKSLATVRALGARPYHRLTLYEGGID